MIILINATDIKAGGGIQVADSICCQLNNYPQHHFVVVLSSYLRKTADRISDYKNVEALEYDCPKYDLRLLLTGRDSYMDNAVSDKGVEAVLSIFGPNPWVPKCPHISGFARPHLIFTESPFFTRMGRREQLKEKLQNAVLKYYFKRSSTYFYTENPLVSERLEKVIKGCKVYTVTNYYNQVFDHPDKWVERQLPTFNGCTILSIAAPYPHKNLAISIDIAKYWLKNKTDFDFRFVFTINKDDFPSLDEELKPHFLFLGKCDITECPSLYRQSDICFLPSLLECFSASCPEAMVMGVPIVTNDLPFFKGLCEDAACYYSPIDVEGAANALYRVANDKVYKAQLVKNGKEQLKKFDTYQQRTEKLLSITESITSGEETVKLTGGAIYELRVERFKVIIGCTCYLPLAFDERRQAA